jgi:hypothetical protein
MPSTCAEELCGRDHYPVFVSAFVCTASGLFALPILTQANDQPLLSRSKHGYGYPRARRQLSSFRDRAICDRLGQKCG